MMDFALISAGDEETRWISGQSRMRFDDTRPHEASDRSGLRQPAIRQDGAGGAGEGQRGW